MRNFKRVWVTLLLALAMIITFMPMTMMTSYAELNEDGSPLHSKTRSDNGDGTYKLELSVTGDADNKLSNDTHINVLIVYDESSSMTMYNAPGSSTSRADHAEDAMYSFINGLINYKNKGVDIYSAVVGFGTGSDIRAGWTNNLTTVQALFDEGTDDNGAVSSVHAYSSHNGTNWSAALSTADSLLGTGDANVNNDGLKDIGRDSYPTFVILVTDGGPTAGGTGATIRPGPTVPFTDYRSHYNAATTAANNIQKRENTTLYGIYAFGDDANLLDDLMYYANTGNHRVLDGYSITNATVAQHDFGQTEPDGVDYYYSAESTQALYDAIDDIFSQIVDAMGIAEVSMSDGTTNAVEVSSGNIASLLTVDQNSYEYWMDIPVDTNNQFKRTVNIDGNAQEITYTVTGSSTYGPCTISWKEGNTNKSVTVNGTLKSGSFKYKWTEKNAFYNFDPPEAILKDDGSVDWDLSAVGVLLDGVTYSVTFDVFPSQYTYDLIADIKNAASPEDAYKALPDNIKKYLKPAGPESNPYTDFALDTNTEAKLKYKDTRTGKSGESTFVNPPAVPTVSSTMNVEKTWDPVSSATDIALTVTKDGKNYEDVALNSGNSYTANINISTGLMRVTYDPNDETKITKVEILDTGHDYAFTEMDDSSYYFDLDAETVRPMLIDSATKVSTLVLVKKASDAQSINTAMGSNNFLQQNGKTYFKIAGKIYELSSTDTAGNLKAKNTKRSQLYLLKNVEGDDPGDGEFTFNLTVNAAYPEHTVDVTAGSESGTYKYTNLEGIEVTVRPDGNSRYIAKYIVPGENGSSDSTVVLYGTVATTNDGSTFTYQEAMWFSVWDLSAGAAVTDLNPSGWTAEELNGKKTGYYYAPTGTPLNNLKMKKTYSLRFGNVPEGTTYTFEETTMPTNYSFVGVDVTKQEQGEDPVDAINTATVTGQKITGTVTESNRDFKVTYTNKYDKAKITVNKVWKGTPADSATVVLYQNGSATQNTATLDADNNWTYTFTGLDTVDSNNKPYEYSVQETAPESGYITTYAGTATVTVKAGTVGEGVTEIEADILAEGEETALGSVKLNKANNWTDKATVEYYKEDGSAKTISVSETTETDTDLTYVVTDREVTVTNEESVDVTVTKVWVDGNNQDGIRPSSVKVQLKNGDNTVGEVELPINNQWTYTWEDLPKNDSSETAIEYTVSEVTDTVITGTDGPGTYKYEVSGSIENGFTVTNTHTPEKTSVYVKKVWVGPAATATINLLADGVSTGTVTLPDDNGKLEYTFTGLDKYKAGQPIVYTVTENEIEGYTSSGPTGSGTEESPFVFTNKNDERVTVSVKKEWDDDNDRDGVRPGSVVVHLQTGGSDVKQDGITARQELNGNNEWTYTWSNLYKYDQSTGDPITYSVKEDDVADYTTSGPTGTGTTADPYVFKNSHTTGKTSVTVTKAWEDGNNQDGIRPDSVTVTLLANGETVSQTGITAAVELNEKNQWTYTWTGLNLKEAGANITYTVEETETDVITGTDGPGTYKDEVSGDATKGFTVTNTHTPEKTSVYVKKVWVGPAATATINLLADGVSTGTVTLPDDNGKLEYTFTGLDKYKAGQPIVYTVTENEIEGYTSSGPTGSGTEESPFVFTNKNDERVTVSVKKEWDDDNDRDGVRPGSVVVHLQTGGSDVKQDGITARQELNGNNEWTYTWSNLYKYDQSTGDPITYSVKEDDVADYTTSGPTGTGTTADPYVFKNSHTTGKTSVTVTKAWEDGNNQDGIRPDSVIVNLLANGKAVSQTGITASVELNEKNEWTYTWSGLNQKEAGKDIEYTVEETKAGVITGTDGPGTYKDEVSGDATKGFTVKNTHTPEKTSATVIKVWDDNDDEAEIRPQELTVTLLADGKDTGKTVTLKGKDWTGTIPDLPKYADGKAISYTWSEPKIENYTQDSNVTKDTQTTITNKKFSDIEVTLKGTKELTGRDLKDGEFTFILKDADGKEVDKATNKDGKFEFKALTFKAPGTYKYTVVEDKKLPDGVKENIQEIPAEIKVAAGTGDDAGKFVATVSGKTPVEWSADFINIYEADPTTVTIVGKKVIEGYPLKGGEFSFTITGESDEQKAEEAPATEEQKTEAAENKEEQKTEAADNTEAQKAEDEAVETAAAAAEAKEAAADAAEELETAQNALAEAEASGDEADVEAAQEAVEKAEAAADDAQAAADAAQTTADEAADAAASTDAAPADTASTDAAPADTAAAETAEAVEEGAEAVEDAVPLPKETTVKNDEKGNVNFGEIKFTKAGTYTYTIKEEKGSLPGVTYDTEAKTVKVVVKDNGKGSLVVDSVTPDEAPRFTFENKYEPKTAESSFTVKKEFAGHSMKDGDFTFALIDEATGKTVATAKNKADGTVTFSGIKFENAGTYNYKVVEVKGSSKAITYDPSSYAVTAKVTDNFDGKPMTVEWSDASSVTFKNTYTGKVYIDPPVKKVVEGSPDTEETYTFKLQANDSSYPMPEAAKGASSMTMTITGTGEKEFGEIYFTKPGTYSYTVTEVAGDNPDCEYDGTVYTVTAVVTEDPDTYELSVKSTYAKDGESVKTAVFQFTNTYPEPDEPDEPKKPKKPDTGDSNNPFAALAVFLLAGAGLGGTAVYRRRKEK